MITATVRQVGEFWEDYAGPNKPLLQLWCMEGGDFPGIDGRGITEDDPVLGGWSKRELRALAVEAGTYHPAGARNDGCQPPDGDVPSSKLGGAV